MKQVILIVARIETGEHKGEKYYIQKGGFVATNPELVTEEKQYKSIDGAKQVAKRYNEVNLQKHKTTGLERIKYRATIIKTK